MPRLGAAQLEQPIPQLVVVDAAEPRRHRAQVAAVREVALLHQAAHGLGGTCAFLFDAAGVPGLVAPRQVDHCHLGAHGGAIAGRDPLGAVVAERIERGAELRRHIDVGIIVLRLAHGRAPGLAQQRHRRARVGVLQQGQQVIEVVGAFDEHGRGTQLVQHLAQCQRAGRAVVAHRGEVDALRTVEQARARAGQRVRQVGACVGLVYCHRPRAASWKAFHSASRLPRSRTTVSK